MAGVLTTTKFEIPLTSVVGDSDSVLVRYDDGRVYGYYYYSGKWYTFGMKTTASGAEYRQISISGNTLTVNITHSIGNSPILVAYIMATTGQEGGNEP